MLGDRLLGQLGTAAKRRPELRVNAPSALEFNVPAKRAGSGYCCGSNEAACARRGMCVAVQTLKGRPHHAKSASSKRSVGFTLSSSNWHLTTPFPPHPYSEELFFQSPFSLPLPAASLPRWAHRSGQPLEGPPVARSFLASLFELARAQQGAMFYSQVCLALALCARPHPGPSPSEGSSS